MTAASDAVREVYDPQWHDKLTRFLPQARRSESDDDVEQDEISGDEGAPAIAGSKQSSPSRRPDDVLNAGRLTT